MVTEILHKYIIFIFRIGMLADLRLPWLLYYLYGAG